MPIPSHQTDDQSARIWSTVALVFATSMFVPLFSCAESAEPDPPGTARRDSAGIELVENRGPGSELPWVVIPVDTIRADRSPEQELLTVPQAGVAATPDGRIVALDSDRPAVVMFDREGNESWRQGRKGEGPGEYQGARAISSSSAGAAVVHDQSKQVLVVLNPDGTLRREQRVTVPGIQGVRLLDDGTVVVQQFLRNPEGSLTRAGARVLALTTGTVGAVDTLRIDLLPVAAAGTVPLECTGGQWDVQFPTFATLPPWDARGERIIVSPSTPEYRLDVLDAGGGLKRIIRRDLAPMTTTQAHAERHFERAFVRMFFPGGEGCAPTPSAAARGAGWLPFVPRVREVRISGDGGVWVRRTSDQYLDPELAEPPVGPIDVFNAAGVFIGSLPPDTPFPLAFRGEDEFLTLGHDDLSVAYIVVWRIERGD